MQSGRNLTRAERTNNDAVLEKILSSPEEGNVAQVEEAGEVASILQMYGLDGIASDLSDIQNPADMIKRILSGDFMGQILSGFDNLMKGSGIFEICGSQNGLFANDAILGLTEQQPELQIDGKPVDVNAPQPTPQLGMSPEQQIARIDNPGISGPGGMNI